MSTFGLAQGATDRAAADAAQARDMAAALEEQTAMWAIPDPLADARHCGVCAYDPPADGRCGVCGLLYVAGKPRPVAFGSLDAEFRVRGWTG